MCLINFSTTPKTKEQKRLKKIWSSGLKRFKVSRFKCNFCDKIKKGQSYSVVDGRKSCLDCDNDYNA